MAEVLSAPSGIESRRVFVDAEHLGNTGSAAMWLALAELRSALEPGATLLALGRKRRNICLAGSAMFTGETVDEDGGYASSRWRKPRRRGGCDEMVREPSGSGEAFACASGRRSLRTRWSEWWWQDHGAANTGWDSQTRPGARTGTGIRPFAWPRDTRTSRLYVAAVLALCGPLRLRESALSGRGIWIGGTAGGGRSCYYDFDLGEYAAAPRDSSQAAGRAGFNWRRPRSIRPIDSPR